MTTTSEHLQEALDGRWRDTKNMIRSKPNLTRQIIMSFFDSTLND